MKLSQVDLANGTGISPTHLAVVERGERSAFLLCFARIAKILRTTVKTLSEAMEDKSVEEQTGQPRGRQPS